MSKKYYLETTSSGKQKFVKLKRSRSHGHPHVHGHGHDHHHMLDHLLPHQHYYHHRHHTHHTHRHCHDEEPIINRDYYKVSVEEWNVLKERERILEESNRALVDENKALRASLATTQGENNRLEQCVIPDLQVQNQTLYADNQALRRTVDNAADQASKQSAEIDRLGCRNVKLERENKDMKGEIVDLKHRVHELSRQLDQSCNRRVSELVGDVSYWRNRFERLRETLELRTQRMEAYEEILRGRRIIP